MAIGIITGQRIGTNRDGDVDRIILQVEFMADDVQTVEMISQCGEDTNPVNGSRVFVTDADDGGDYKVGIGITDDKTPESDPGEKEFYSLHPVTGVKLARFKLDGSGNVIHNEGAESAVSYAALNTALQQLITDINAEFATKQDAAGSAGTLTLDITGSESPTVKVP